MTMKTEAQVRQYKHALELLIVGGLKATTNPITQLLALDLKKRLDVIKWVLGEYPDPPSIAIGEISKMEEELARHKVNFKKAKRELEL